VPGGGGEGEGEGEPVISTLLSYRISRDYVDN